MTAVLRPSPFRRLIVPDAENKRAAVTASAVRGGMMTNAAYKLSSQLLQLGVQVVLSRILSPTDFGLTVIVMVFAGLANLFTEFGLGAAVIQRPRLTQDYAATAFWANALSGVLLTALFIGLAWPVAGLYGKPQLVILMIIISLSFTLSTSAVQVGLLERNFQYRSVARLEFASVFLGAATGLCLAFFGVGAASLALMFVATGFSRTLLSWSVAGGVPRGHFNKSDLRELVRFCRGLLGFGVVNYFASNFDNLVIGRVSSAAALGLYARAYNLMLLPVAQVQQILGRVLYPALASMQHDRARLKRGFENALVAMAALGVPISVGIAVAAGPLVRTLYGPAWDGTAHILRILAFTGVPVIIGSALSLGLQALGLTGLQFRRGLITAGGTVVAVSVGVIWGPVGVATGLVLRAYLTLPLNYMPCARAMSLSTRSIVLRIAPVLVAAGAGGAVALFETTVISVSWLTLLVQMLSMGIVYVALLRILARGTFDTIFAALIPARLKRIKARRVRPGRHSLSNTGKTL